MGSFEEQERKKAAEARAKLQDDAAINLKAEKAAHRFAEDLVSWLGAKQRTDVQVRVEVGNNVVLTHGKQQMSVMFKTDNSCMVVGVDGYPQTTDDAGAKDKVIEWVNNPMYIAGKSE